MATSAQTAAPAARAPLSARVSWMLFDWSVQPFYTLILTFLFAPYFANIVVGNGPKGQSMWGFGAAVAGVLIAVGSPFLGAFADGRGQRKPWIALFSVILAIAMASLWIATPSAPPATIYLVLFAFVVATVCAEYTAVFTNAIMPSLVPHSEVGRLSGAGWACGYFGGLASLGVRGRISDKFDLRLEAQKNSILNPFSGRDSFRSLAGETIDEPTRVSQNDVRLYAVYHLKKHERGTAADK